MSDYTIIDLICVLIIRLFVELNAANFRSRSERNREDRDREPRRFEGDCNFLRNMGIKMKVVGRRTQKTSKVKRILDQVVTINN